MDKASETTGRTLRRFALAATIGAIAIGAILLMTTKGQTTMVPTETPAAARPDIPPIDANAPTETKTATFAMG